MSDVDLWLEEYKSVGGKVLPDNTVWLYHATSKAAADEIVKTGVLKAPPGTGKAYGVYAGSSPAVAESYGEGTLVPIRVKITDLHPEDIYPGRRMDFRIASTSYRPVEIGKPFTVAMESSTSLLEEQPAIEEEMSPKIIRQYPLGPGDKMPKRMNLPPMVNIPPIKGSREPSEKVTIPTSLTMAQYNRSWKPKGWNIIFIGPTKTWRSEWGVWEAIREIVQNALDEAESYQYGFDNQGFYIKDSGRGIGVRDFLLGPPKLKEAWARGKYGEGMKIGALALVREGFPVYVEAADRQVIICFLEQEVQGKVETLAALWRQGEPKVGTTWHIMNYHGDDFADRFYPNLPREATLALVPSQLDQPVQRYNALIEYDFTGTGKGTSEGIGPSRIFARDIYMRDITSPFSYNLWGFELAPDRHAPKDESDMWHDAGRVWACIKDQKLLETFFKMMVDPPEIESTEFNNLNLSYLGNIADGRTYASIFIENEAVWVKAWNKVQGEDTVLRTSDRWDGTVKHLGYKSVNVGYSVKNALENIIKTDRKLIDDSQEKLREVQVIKDEDLEPRQLASLNLVRAIVDYSTSSWNKVGGVNAAIIPPASDRVRTAGLYSRTTQEIFISADQLNYGHTAVDVGIHELAHHTSQAEDSEKGHYDAISEIAGRVVSYTSNRNFDREIAKPDFMW